MTQKKHLNIILNLSQYGPMEIRNIFIALGLFVAVLFGLCKYEQYLDEFRPDPAKTEDQQRQAYSAWSLKQYRKCGGRVYAC
jgi:hypothetical protein